jgi:hypothetical protein
MRRGAVKRTIIFVCDEFVEKITKVVIKYERKFNVFLPNFWQTALRKKYAALCPLLNTCDFMR